MPCVFLALGRPNDMQTRFPKSERDTWTGRRRRRWRRRRRKGDIVSVYPTGFEFGAEERKPQYVRIRVNGMDLPEGQTYIGRVIQETPSGQFDDDGAEIIDEEVLARHHYRIPFSTVDEALIEPQGRLTMNRARFVGEVIENTGGADEDDG